MSLSWADLGEDYKEVGDRRYYRVCPICGDTRYTFYVYSATGVWGCFSGAHDATGVLDGVDLPPDDPGDAVLRQLEEKPAVWNEIGLPSACRRLGAFGEQYLLSRGILVSVGERLGIWEDGSHGSHAIVFPMFSSSGVLIYWSERATNDWAQPKYLHAPGRHPLYVPDWHRERGNMAVLVEGPLDAAKVHQAGYRVAALLGKSLPRYLLPMLREFIGDRQLMVWLDPDALAAAAAISSRHNGTVVLGYDDRDPAEHTVEEIQYILNGGDRDNEEVWT
jgi:hypothetical protein